MLLLFVGSLLLALALLGFDDRIATCVASNRRDGNGTVNVTADGVRIRADFLEREQP
jgi:hypothetical protein